MGNRCGKDGHPVEPTSRLDLIDPGQGRQQNDRTHRCIPVSHRMFPFVEVIAPLAAVVNEFDRATHVALVLS